MDINSLLKNQSSRPLIERDADPHKYDIVVARLCEKRKKLEKELNTPDLDPSTREDSTLSLVQLKSSMSTFGISEIDYQAYLASINEDLAQTSLFEDMSH